MLSSRRWGVSVRSAASATVCAIATRWPTSPLGTSPAVAAMTNSSPSSRSMGSARGETRARPRGDQGAPALGHQLQDAIEVGLAAERQGDLHGGVQRGDRARELLALGL